MPDDKVPPPPFSFNPFAEPDRAPADVDDAPPAEPTPASMSMTKAELLDRLREQEEGMTKAAILERIHRLETGEADVLVEDVLPGENFPVNPAAPVVDIATEKRSVTLNGMYYSWTKATEETVPEEARLIWARARRAEGV